VLLACLLLSVARAPARAEPDALQRTLQQAVEAFDAGRFVEAQAHFREAHALAPSARTLRALGMVAFELHDYAASVSYLEQSLVATVKPLDASLRREAKAVLARAEKSVARVVFQLSPRDAQLRVDEAPVLVSEGRPVALNPGRHVVAVQAAGRAPLDTEVVLQPGEERVLSLALAPEAKPAAKSEDTQTGRPLYKNPWLWTGVGVVVVGVVTGLAVGLTRDPKERPVAAVGGDTGAVLTGP
jgi:tetratricopeptide (TPR) repeat protein